MSATASIAQSAGNSKDLRLYVLGCGVLLYRRLAKFGHKPDDITFVTASHAHWDHTANLCQFAHDTWLVSNYTRDKPLSQDPLDKTDPSMFAALKDTKTTTLPDDKDYDVFGDGTVIDYSRD